MNSRLMRQWIDKGEEAEWREDWDAADEAYRQATINFPRHSITWAHYGEFQRFYRHKDEEATRAFERAINCSIPDPESLAYAWRGLGELAEKHGDTQRALELMHKSLEQTSLADTHRSLAHLYGRLGRTEDAARHSRLAAEANPTDPIALLLYAAQLERAGQRVQGQQVFAKALRLGGCGFQAEHNRPVHCCVFYNAAGYYAVRGENGGALKMLEAFFKTPNHRHLSREDIIFDPDFVELKNDAGFMRLVNEFVPEGQAPAGRGQGSEETASGTDRR